MAVLRELGAGVGLAEGHEVALAVIDERLEGLSAHQMRDVARDRGRLQHGDLRELG